MMKRDRYIVAALVAIVLAWIIGKGPGMAPARDAEAQRQHRPVVFKEIK